MKPGLLSILCLFAFVCSSWQRPISFKPSKNTFTIAVISDLNSSYGSTVYHPDVYATLKELDSLKPDLILCGGDMVAGQKATLTTKNIQEMWSSFGKHILQPIQQMKIPFGFTVGNHDASPSYQQDRALAKTFWQTQQHNLGLNFIDQSNFPFYFSYKQNDIFFISWDAAGANVDDKVWEWMKKQLQSKMAKKAKLRVLLGHLPLYAIVASKNKPGEVLAEPQRTMDFFKEHHIDLYISGHQHAYYPAQKEGIRLLNTACIGEGPRALIGDTRPATRAYTLIEVPLKTAKNFTYKTFVPNQKQTIELSNLPDSIIGFNGVSKKDLK
ncbi:metallophosphoesterase [Pedobacter sp. ASV28]|uniref:metallophosphoesterase family protein n=1 Tax=Pedobacter sp. ASV28 TaxID=2795123 RepID=UPI0018EC12D2|nr:metallophosphoesterase [Pedobacter sp. ASV28]